MAKQRRSRSPNGGRSPARNRSRARSLPPTHAELGAASSAVWPDTCESGHCGLPFDAAVDRVIREHLDDLRKPGVLSVRPGYQAAGGWLTKKPAIVATVESKTDDLAPGDRLPETVGGLAVDVRQAGPMQRLRASNPNLYAAVKAQSPPEYLAPEFPLERDLDGALLNPSPAAAAATAKPVLAYVPPAGATLAPIEDTFTLTCHVSPDAGWLELEPFLMATRSQLTVGMYDFTSAHILATLQASLAGRRRLDLVLDHPALDRTADQTDEQTQSALASALKSRLDFAWALEARDPKAAAAIFPSAYHIKVAVRDGASMWLSSGNWNNSNQPDIDPFTDPAGALPLVKTSDRDWHVIVEHAGLSALFQTYLENDLRVAAQHQAAAAAPPAAAGTSLAALAAPGSTPVAPAPAQYFSPLTLTAPMTIQPALTPDNYPQVILALLDSATKSLYVQVPYITPTTTPAGMVLAGLIAVIAKKIRAGLDVRLIMSSFETLGALEQLQGAGIDSSVVRIQKNLHNKGIIVDSAVVAVGSQNWSAPGVTTNRDATLVIHNAQAAQYWEAVFLHDWSHMATQQAAD